MKFAVNDRVSSVYGVSKGTVVRVEYSKPFSWYLVRWEITGHEYWYRALELHPEEEK